MVDLAPNTMHAISNPTAPSPVVYSVTKSSSPVIIIVTRYGRLSGQVMDYGVNVADRLGCRLLLVFVNTMPLLWDGVQKRKMRKYAIEESVQLTRSKADSRDVTVDYVEETGRVSKVIHSLCHIVKRVEFVVIDKGINPEKATFGAPVPVFNVLSGNVSPVKQGVPDHPGQAESHRNGNSGNTFREWVKTTVFATLTAVLYAALVHYCDEIMVYWTEGGIYSFLPAVSSCVFCCVQISLAESLQTALRLKAYRTPYSKGEMKGRSSVKSKKQSRARTRIH